MSLEIMKKKHHHLYIAHEACNSNFVVPNFSLFRDLNSFSLKVKISEILGSKTAGKFIKKTNMF